MKNKRWQVEGAWVPKRLDLLQSAAWRNAPRALKALLEVLEIEHMRKKGSANGELFFSYPQFVAAGFNRTTVSSMTKLGEALGLLKVNRETGVGRQDLHDACAYTLTYLPTGIIGNLAPTDDWKRIKTDEQALLIVQRMRERKASRKKDRRAA
ncbi:hypothetical protein M0654_03585 [Rhizobium sp. NTR19]|uniref:Replication protein n=1 Tax=Neorhizobium turbinariae TaxID=2937795 RepID=A0ABT0IMI8_9HYPH|nr:hypothetical protein [Neorhizobium turbinariae]MCK8779061.1 hypothetical protein [Neorhizobium turbinariae]